MQFVPRMTFLFGLSNIKDSFIG